MAIVVACRCGQAFEADLYLAGKVIQCPACRSPLAVPSPPVEPTSPTHVPRERTGLSREAREANESLTSILVVGGVLLFAVFFISVGILCYVKGGNPLLWAEKAWNERPVASAPEAESAGPVPVTSSAPVFPNGWRFFEHEAGKFSALLPDYPDTSVQTEEGFSGTQTSYELTARQYEHVYQAIREFRRWRIEKDQEPAAYDALVNKRVSELVGGKIEGSHQTTVDGRLVCDAILSGKFEGTEVRKYVRFIATGDTVLELSCRVPPGKERPQDIKLFLGNYKFQ